MQFQTRKWVPDGDLILWCWRELWDAGYGIHEDNQNGGFGGFFVGKKGITEIAIWDDGTTTEYNATGYGGTFCDCCNPGYGPYPNDKKNPHKRHGLDLSLSKVLDAGFIRILYRNLKRRGLIAKGASRKWRRMSSLGK